MKQAPILAIASLSMVFATTSCIDDKYDLSDIDKTIQVSVNDLVIPVNIDEIKLKSIIEETDEIKVIDGEYAYVTDGTFDSDPISISEFLVRVGNINDSNFKIKSIGGVPVPNVDINYDIDDPNHTAYSAYSIVATDIQKNIKDLTKAYGNITLKITFDLSSFKSLSSKLGLRGIQLQLPKNLEIVPSNEGSYDASTGIYTLSDVDCSTDTSFLLTISATSLALPEGQFEAGKGSSPDRGRIEIDGEIGLAGGTFFISKDWQRSSTLPESLGVTLKYQIPNFTVDYLDGSIEYDIENVNIPDVSLDDIPDFLNQPGTNLMFANPTLYLSTNNPLEEDNLYAETGIEISAYRDGEATKTFTPDSKTFTIAKDQTAVAGKYNFVISPEKPQTIDNQYPEAKFVKFTSLSDVLSGNGLPKTLSVSLINPQIPLQKATRFHLGAKYDGIDGSYKFIAPFNLKEGSVIYYSDTMDGWADEDLDALTITNLEINMNVTTDIPLGVKFTCHPIDKEGNRIAGVTIEGADISGNAKDQAVSVKVTGTINELDGIEFEATALSAGGPLKPDHTIILKNVRPKVKGYYTKEL